MYELITPNKRILFDSIAAERTRHLAIVLENIYQDHNASAIIRSCDCFGIQDLYTIEKNNEYIVNGDIALGAGRWVDLHNFSEEAAPEVNCIAALREKGYKIVATSPHSNGNTIQNMDLSQPIAMVFGTERQGLSDQLINMADELVQIPMFGFTESLNVSVAAAITMNVIRERLQNSTIDWKLSEDQLIQLKLSWCRKILNGGEALEKRIRSELFEKE
ncbi:MAG: RNA methyltransferase [Bacteroidota bacterium]